MRRTLMVVGTVTLVVVLLLPLAYAVDVFLLLFTGILLAVFLQGLSDWLSQPTHLSGGWSLAAVMLGLAGILGSAEWLLAPNVAAQVDQLTQTLPASVARLQQHLEQYQWGRWILSHTPKPSDLLGTRNIAAKATGVFSTTFGLVANIVIVLVVGFYLAVEPRLYANGMVRLLPISRRELAWQVLGAVGYTLRWWLVAE